MNQFSTKQKSFYERFIGYLDFSYQLNEKLLSVTFRKNTRKIVGVEVICVNELRPYFLKYLVNVDIRSDANQGALFWGMI